MAALPFVAEVALGHAPPVERPTGRWFRELLAACLERDGHQCVYCYATSGPFELDHIIPLCRGGSNAMGNLATACASCNRAKGSLTFHEWKGC